MQHDKAAPLTTLGDRVAAVLKKAGEQAMRQSNMGQVEAYRINHVISLVERECVGAAVSRDLLLRLYRCLDWICGEGFTPVPTEWPGVPDPDDLYLELGAIVNPEGKDAREIA